MSILPFSLLLGAILFLAGSKYYLSDMEKVAKIRLETSE